jgi:hypothetical protein
MTFHERYLAGCAALAVAALVTASPTRAQAPTQPQDAALNAEAAQNDWPTHHGTYKSYHYSGLDQINTGNVKNLEVAWMHFPERATRGIQSTPLALDGVLYYSRWTARPAGRSGPTRRSSTRSWSPSRRTRRTTAASPSDMAISMSGRSMGA